MLEKRFLDIADKHCNKKNKRKDNLQKIFNRKILKVGYSCTANFGNMIRNYKKNFKNILKTPKQLQTQKLKKSCNSRKNDTYPVNQNCLSETVVYAVLIKENNSEETKFKGSTEGPLKQRIYGHKPD